MFPRQRRSPEGHLNNTIERTGAPWNSPFIPKFTSDGRPVIAGDIPGRPLGADDTYGSYGLEWASASNTPFRRHKIWLHEGGISTPCIIHWPKRIKDGGALRNDISHIIDFMPTFLEASGAEYPAVFNGFSVTKPQGRSLLPVIDGEKDAQRVVCWEHEGNRAVRKGKWKLVSEYPGQWRAFYPAQSGKWELYDISADRGELNNLAEKYPEKVKQLSTLYQQWAEKVGAVDWEKLACSENVVFRPISV